jgi:hypothetical protein
MNASRSLRALRRANPRAKPAFAATVDATAVALRERMATTADVRPDGFARRRLARVFAAGASLAAAATVTLAAVGLPGGAPGVESAVAAVKRAATLTSASAERSGTAIVRIRHGGELWVASTIVWNGDDLAVSQHVPRRPGRPGSALLVVDGLVYGIDPGDGAWVVLGSPKSIDPDSGTTPDEYLAAVREDVGGATLRRITDGMTGLQARSLEGGTTVYTGTVAAALIAREAGFKEGQAIRVLPFGYVAHDEAADPAAPLDVALTVAADGIVRRLAATWGSGASAWTYTVTYRGLGSTRAPVAPANARPFPDRSVPED